MSYIGSICLYCLTDEKPYLGLDASSLLPWWNHEALLQRDCVCFEVRREENDALNKAFVFLQEFWEHSGKNWCSEYEIPFSMENVCLEESILKLYC